MIDVAGYRVQDAGSGYKVQGAGFSVRKQLETCNMQHASCTINCTSNTHNFKSNLDKLFNITKSAYKDCLNESDS
jgi:hypothetical protein